MRKRKLGTSKYFFHTIVYTVLDKFANSLANLAGSFISLLAKNEKSSCQNPYLGCLIDMKVSEAWNMTKHFFFSLVFKKICTHH